MAFRSAAGVVMGAMLNFSTRTFRTAGVTNAGRLGPRRTFLIPRYKQRQQDGHGLLLVPAQDQRQRQLVDLAAEGIGQGRGDLNGRVGIVALSTSSSRGKPSIEPNSSLLKRYLPQASVRMTQSSGTAWANSACTRGWLVAVAAADQEEMADLPALDKADDLVRGRRARRCGRSRR